MPTPREAVALRLGWRWIAFEGIPAKGTPGYPNKCRVRRFFAPESLANKKWQEHWAANKVGPATGQEPLDYAYCSSNGPDPVPPYEQSLAAAEAVLDWLTANGWFPEMRYQGGSTPWQVRAAHFKPSGPLPSVVCAQATTLPLAICRAFVQLPLPEKAAHA